MQPEDGNRILFFSEAFEQEPEEIGGKGYGLAQMTRLGMPVPPGFIIPVSFCRKILDKGFQRYHDELKEQTDLAIKKLEKIVKRKFGDPKKPLFVSVRSGAPISMPGMMETILNIGLSEKTVNTFARLTNLSFAQEMERKFKFYGTYANIEWQITQAIREVIFSWESPEAKNYRKANAISQKLGTAVIVQMMAFGNHPKRSGTGVVFSRNVKSGEPGLWGEYLTNSQGEKLVSGSTTPQPISKLKESEPRIYQQLDDFSQRLEKVYKNAVDIEFTVENGKLWLLQVREAKCSPLATAKIIVDLVEEGILSKEQAVTKTDRLVISYLKRPKVYADRAMLKSAMDGKPFAKGLPASDGFACGKAVFSSNKAVELSQKGEKVILVRSETEASDIEGIVNARAIVTAKGGQTCHAAVVARAMGKPAVVGIDNLEILDEISNVTYLRDENYRTTEFFKEGDLISVDGNLGLVVLGNVGSRTLQRDRCAQRLIEWEKLFPQKPKLNLSLVDNQFSINCILADFYISDRLVNDLARTAFAWEAEHLRCRVHQNAAQIVAIYLLLAIAGEARHSWRKTHEPPEKESPEAKLREDLLDKLNIFKIYQGGIEREVLQNDLLERIEERQSEEIQSFVMACYQVFDRLSWDGTSFGGKPWAEIAKTLHRYLTGEWDETTFVDRSFNLRHNNSLSFDKHPMVYKSTDEDFLEEQLEMKRVAKNLEELEEALTNNETDFSPEVGELLEKAKLLIGVQNEKS